MKRKICFLLFIASLFFSFSSKAAIVYVDSAHVGGTQTGTSWATAFSNFQSGINAANAGDSVWVAKGTYMPNNVDSMYFKMKQGVKTFGGFLNTQSSFTQRNWEANVTIIKGNGYQVIRNIGGNITNATILDGFKITDGNAIWVSGGGVYNDHASPTFRHCTFSLNSADENGGGMCNINSSPIIDSCIFLGNTTKFGGGAIFNSSSYPVIINSLFVNNVSQLFHRGGAIYNLNSRPTINKCRFLNNTAQSGSAIYNYAPDSIQIQIDISNCDFIGNVASGEGAVCNDVSIFSSVIKDCSFSGNIATKGGAIANYCNSATIKNCDFNSNKAIVDSFDDRYGGGAIYNSHSSTSLSDTVSISNCRFEGNKVEGRGGAIFNTGGGPTTIINNCRFVADSAYSGGAICNLNINSLLIQASIFKGNMSTEEGGAVSSFNSYGIKLNNLLLKNNVSNIGAAIFNQTVDANINNCTVINNANIDAANQSCIYSISYPFRINVSNSIVLNNTGGIDNNSSTSISYSLIQGMQGNTALHILADTTNPQFVNPSAENYQLVSTSPCINAGSNDSIPTGITKDLLNNERIYDNTVDLGCYEFYIPSINLGNDTTICTNDSVNLNGLNNGSAYLWSTGDTTQNIWVHTGGTYYVTITNAGGVATDTIQIVSNSFLYVALGNDTTINQGSSIILNAGPGATYLWSTGATTQTINVTTSGSYSVVVTNSAGCTGTDTIVVTVNPVGIDDINTSKNSLVVYPSPAKETIHIRFTDEKLLHTKAILTDIYGRTFRELMLNSKSQQLSMAGLTSGVYILKTANGQSVKIVKE